jgi:hypothetical protein
MLGSLVELQQGEQMGESTEGVEGNLFFVVATHPEFPNWDDHDIAGYLLRAVQIGQGYIYSGGIDRCVTPYLPDQHL